MPDTSPSDTSLSPDFDADAYGPPVGCVDALASWRKVIRALERLKRSLDRVDVALGEVQEDLGATLDAESARVDG